MADNIKKGICKWVRRVSTAFIRGGVWKKLWNSFEQDSECSGVLKTWVIS
jgi:hypothetical protein